MIDKGKTFKDFELIVVYSGISKNLMATDFNNRIDEVRVAGWLLAELAGLPLPLRKRNTRNEVDFDILKNTEGVYGARPSGAVIGLIDPL